MSEIDVKKYEITGAGLIILAPFIPALFERAGYVLDQRKNNSNDKLRAILLLHHMVYGKQPAGATDLFLPQLLCNMPTTTLHPPFPDVTKKESELSILLLRTVIQSWSKINQTTIEGFRDSFLQREGKLIIEDDEAHLVVQQRGYDILLSSLPWSIAITKLRWMDRPLFTRWK